MIAAEKAGKTPQAFVAEIAAGRKQYLDGFHIALRQLALDRRAREPRSWRSEIYLALRKNELIDVRTIEQFFDPVKGMFLPDRYIKGECPNCGTKDQYGDNCENCGAVYAPTDLKNPYSALCGAKPVLRSSEHYFFRLSDPRCVEFLQDWTQDGKLQPEVANKVREWFALDEHGVTRLGDWDISRDAPYFGIEIPDAPGKYFYVWLDAPVGYLASLKNLFSKRGEDFDAYLADPALRAGSLHRQGHRHLPHAVLAGDAAFLGPQDARPRLRARLHHGGRRQDEQEPRHRHQPAALPRARPRRAVAALLHRRQAQRARRGHRLQPRGLRRPRQCRPGRQVHQHRQPRRRLPDQALRRPSCRPTSASRAARCSTACARTAPTVQQLYDEREFGKAVREIMLLADRVNEYVDQHKPWELAKHEAASAAALHDVCTVCIEAFRVLTIYLKPILPALAAQVEAFLHVRAVELRRRTARARRATASAPTST